ncbi:MAG: ACT domain-containing protein [Firmicutes bacterium]|nr:ACT domain-containing protein [Bacillota bacterium]
MIARQISVFLENRPGRLSDVLEELAAVGINLRAIAVADTTDFGIMRLMVDRPDEAEARLKAAGFTCTINDVISVEIPDTPGALAKVTRTLANEGINVNYLYPFSRSALLLLKTDDNRRAVEVLSRAGFSIVDEDHLYRPEEEDLTK